jgi:hypothetical protein
VKVKNGTATDLFTKEQMRVLGQQISATKFVHNNWQIFCSKNDIIVKSSMYKNHYRSCNFLTMWNIPDFLDKILASTLNAIFVIYNFIVQLLHCKLTSLIKAYVFTLLMTGELVACSSTVCVAHVRPSPHTSFPFVPLQCRGAFLQLFHTSLISCHLLHLC